MKKVSFYHEETGQLHPTVLTVSDERMVELNTPPGHCAIDGHHDYRCQRVDLTSGQVVEHRPDPPSADHVWDENTREWQPSPQAVAHLHERHRARHRIAELEAQQPRVIRELLLGESQALERLRVIDDEISTLRPALK